MTAWTVGVWLGHWQQWYVQSDEGLFCESLVSVPILLSRFTLIHISTQPGLLKAVQTRNLAAIQKLISLWCNIDSNIKVINLLQPLFWIWCVLYLSDFSQGGKSAWDIASSLRDSDIQGNKCYNLLLQNSHRLRLVHAVLSEDSDRLQQLLENDDSNLNFRYGVRLNS